MSTAQFTRRQLVALPLLASVCVLNFACSGGEGVPPEPSGPPLGSYEDFTPEELVQVLNLRENDVPVREQPGDLAGS